MTPNTDSVAVLRQIAHEMRTRYALPTGHGAVYGVVANNAVDVAAMLLNWAGRVGAAATALEAQASAPESGSWIAADDVKRLTRQIDVAFNGEEGAAKQAALCDIASQVCIIARRVGPILPAFAKLERERREQASAPGGEVTELLAEAFDAGFSISAEGWNGEYGASTDGRYYLEKRAAALADIAARQQEAARAE